MSSSALATIDGPLFGFLKVPPGVEDWYKETIYGQDRHVGIRRLASLAEIVRLEFEVYPNTEM